MNAQFPSRVLNVAKRELHLGFCAVRPGEEVVPHCHGRWAIDDHLLIFEPYIGPMLNRKTIVFWAGSILAHEVGHCAFEGGAELLLSGEGWFEQHRSYSIGIERFNVGSCTFDVVHSCIMSCGNFYDSLSPGLLGFLYICRGNHLDAIPKMRFHRNFMNKVHPLFCPATATAPQNDF